jgi:Spy/CpxP family protein refolding chaperone
MKVMRLTKVDSDVRRDDTGGLSSRRKRGPTRTMAASFGALLLSIAAHAADATAEVPMRDPWVPPAARQAASAPLTRGAALHAQVEAKLRKDFEAADVEKRGSITREQARAANLGLVADQFDRIDVRRTGRVSFEDLKRYLRGRGAATL